MEARWGMKSSPYYYEESKPSVDEDDHLVDRVKDNKDAKFVKPLN